ncbi:MAG TPA: purine-nucleoside phosphorylase [Desulfobulbaceae bacterium]|nr:purine-nucleoside phosphorylase [Desulfobulbaceae bacterium]
MIDMAAYRLQVEEAVAFLRDRLPFLPEIVVALGTGLGGLAGSLARQTVIPYREIPHFPLSTVASHAGNLVCGELRGKNVAVLQGRVHCYEGYTAREVALPMRVLALLGARLAIVTNASGGLNPDFAPGTIMVCTDHLNLLGDNPLRGPNVEEWGPRFPDLSKPYAPHLVETALAAAQTLRLDKMATGTYVCIPGPSLETPAETRYLRSCGADAVGMSSLPEILVALHAGLQVLGLAVVANANDPDNLQPILLEDIVRKAEETEPLLLKLIAEIITRY